MDFRAKRLIGRVKSSLFQREIRSPERWAALIAAVCLLVCPTRGFSWGDRGHEIIGLIAEHYLEPAVRERVIMMLRNDSSGLTPTTSIADEATWADKFRDSDRETDRVHYRATRDWHYVDIELDRPDIDAACFGHPSPGNLASAGPPDDCIVDKIEQFRRELRDAATAPAERLLALQYLLHLVGDVHQPLHAADDHDHGGNTLRVRTADHRAGNLHHYWDTEFVPRDGTSAEAAADLIAGLTSEQRRRWSTGTPTEWALESFEIARLRSYGELPHTGATGASGRRRRALLLDDRYEADAQAIVAMQLQRAGVRLARLLNESLQ